MCSRSFRAEVAELAQHGKPPNAELVDASEAIRYQLLKANCDTAEGALALQPWLVVEQPDLLASDLCRAWIGALQDLGLTHLSERLDDQVLFNVKRRSAPKAEADRGP